MTLSRTWGYDTLSDLGIWHRSGGPGDMDSRRTTSRSSMGGRGEAGDPRRTPLPPGQAEEAVFAQSLDPRRAPAGGQGPRGPGPPPRTAGDPRRTPGAVAPPCGGPPGTTSSQRFFLFGSAGVQAHSQPARPPWLGRGTPEGPPGAVAPPAGGPPGTAARQARNGFFSLALAGSRLTLSPPGRPGLAGGPPPRPGDPRRTPRGPPPLPRAEERLSGSLGPRPADRGLAGAPRPRTTASDGRGPPADPPLRWRRLVDARRELQLYKLATVSPLLCRGPGSL